MRAKLARLAAARRPPLFFSRSERYARLMLKTRAALGRRGLFVQEFHNLEHVVLETERQLTLMLMADVSASQDFGSETRSKREAAAELCALLAFSAPITAAIVRFKNGKKNGQYVTTREFDKHENELVVKLVGIDGKLSAMNTRIGDLTTAVQSHLG